MKNAGNHELSRSIGLWHVARRLAARCANPIFEKKLKVLPLALHRRRATPRARFWKMTSSRWEFPAYHLQSG